jgi:drug/metabolite transporter (DMT)-like permease
MPVRPPAPPRDLLRGVGWALGSALCSAGFMIPWKLASRHGAGKHAVLVLLASAAILNSAALWLPAPALRRRWTPTATGLSIALAVLTLLGNEASAAAIARISGPLLSVLQRFDVVVVGVLAWIVLSERMDGAFIVGAVLATAGVAVTQGAAPSVGQGAGVLYGLAAAVAFGGMVVVTRQSITEIDPVRVNALRLWLSVLLWAGLHRELPTASQLSPELLLWSGLAALLGPFLGRLSLMYSLRHVEARIAALCVLAAPVATLGLSWALLGDVPSAVELAGGTVILAGVAIPVVAAARRRHAPRGFLAP